jgi:addiction module HigA family antidote
MSKLPITIKEVPLGPALVTPGDVLLEEFLLPRGISRTALAKKMGVDPMRVSEIVRGKRAITAQTALLLSSVLGTSPRFWLGIQNDYDLAVAASGTRGSLAASAALVRKAKKIVRR